MEAWFDQYLGRFRSGDPRVRANVDLKDRHSRRVARDAARIAASLDLPEDEAALARIAALLHDVGRFEQAWEQGSFDDRVAGDHGERGAVILEQENVLGALDAGDREAVLAAVRHHNDARLPGDLGGKAGRIARIVRDADKLDVLGVLADFYAHPGRHAGEHLEYAAEEGEDVSPAVLEAVRAGRCVDVRDLGNRIDHKVMRLSWVFDLNHPRTFRLLQERGHLEAIASTLPDAPRATEAKRLTLAQAKTPPAS